ncbi:TetR/AcrR family transcriptional regulator [Geosporobacter ferrireducens]|uniref:HTH tetR-type domain-containing protein n=1 Tax=Geosporobacter ferrireducens TaxID=1424294 RepID=A0A1D8GN40_9FIRM|nr:helix-turn-helix domain-containing protein [Geosporobacter ferrireducens]AOT72304.1 hypothetical protein Gferi_23805 [Geosporobacter ferrireducens]
MYKSLEKLPDEKRDLILRVSMEEFVEKGYDKASTDRITQRAEISKSLLFYYFKNKKGLFLYLVEHTRNLLEQEVRLEIEKLEEDDYFFKTTTKNNS